MDMIKFPIQFGRNGFKKLPEGTSDYYAQLLSIAVLTEPRTHIFTPKFGVLDPAFRGIDRGLFILTAARFVPEVIITGLETSIDESTGTMKVDFSFKVKEDGL